jgi:hypothetical protein
MLKEIIYFFFTSFKSNEPKIAKIKKSIGTPEIGQEIGTEKGGVRIKITQINSHIRAEIIAADNFWTDGIKYKPGQKSYFVVGETIIIEQDQPEYGDRYHIKSQDKPNRLPWFVFGQNNNGDWYFEHYR